MTGEGLDALVVGGGPAGSFAALCAARAGRKVLLIERTSGSHDKVCGEFISGEACAMLAETGLDLSALGALPIDTVRLAAGHRVAEARLPFHAMGLSRRILDEALLSHAATAGACIMRGRAVRRLERQGQVWVATLDSGEMHTAPTVFLATGKHDLRDHGRPSGRDNGKIGFKMHLQLSASQQQELARTVELILFPAGYAGLQAVDPKVANLCLVVEREAFQNVGANWAAILEHLASASPHLQRRLADSQPLWPKPLAIASIPYGYVLCAGQVQEGLYRLGDQAACIPSFTGDGMAIALHSAHHAVSTWLEGHTPITAVTSLSKNIHAPMRWAKLLSGFLQRPAGAVMAVRLAQIMPILLRSGGLLTRIT